MECVFGGLLGTRFVEKLKSGREVRPPVPDIGMSPGVGPGHEGADKHGAIWNNKLSPSCFYKLPTRSEPHSVVYSECRNINMQSKAEGLDDVV